jgi:hypothetical protein
MANIEIISVSALDLFVPPSQKINERAQYMQKEDHQDPHDLFRVREPGVLDAIDQHPDPKYEDQNADHQRKKPQHDANYTSHIL